MIQLRRIVSSESWVPEIDGLRFIALIAVLLFHITAEVLIRGTRPLHGGLPVWLFELIGHGDRGVGLFFVISGFVLARPFYAQLRLGQRAVRLPGYFLRRITRLEPPFLLSMMIYVLAWKLVVHWPTGDLARQTLLSSLYLHNVLDPGRACFPNFVTWSLEVEVQFYILAPLLCQLFRVPQRWLRRLCLAGLSLAGCFWSARHFSSNHHPYLRRLLSSRSLAGRLV